MQSYSNFTVGGSLSVNVHGRYVGEGPLIRAVESIRLVLADGSVKDASRAQNSDLFFGAIGGYGGIGVIVEAELQLARDVHVSRVSRRMPVGDYKNYFMKEVRGSKVAVFHNADLYPPAFARVNAVTWNESEEPVTVAEKLAPQARLTGTEQFVLSWFSKGPLGKQVRQYVYDPYVNSGKRVEWRNYEASYDVLGLEPVSREKSTYVLQEYFVPVEHFDAFVPKMARVFQSHGVNVINVSIRHALPDTGSLLAWARTEVFAFVVYYLQGTTETAKREVYAWTGELISAALAEGGTYYLPYQIVGTPEQFAKAYPRAPEYFALKRKVDPTYKLRNKLWDRYYIGVKKGF
jgi:FAD/FMN-containing dehydrogenase